MSLTLLALLAAEALERDPAATICPVASKDGRCGSQLGCHRPFDVAALLDHLPPAVRPMRWLCGEFLTRRGAVAALACRELPRHPAGNGRGQWLGDLPVAGGLSPLLRWLEGNDAACFLLWGGPAEDGFWRLLYAYLHLPTATTVHVVAGGPAERLAILRTMRAVSDAEAWESLVHFVRRGE